MNKQKIKQFFFKFFVRVKYQKFFEKLYIFSLMGMNYGNMFPAWRNGETKMFTHLMGELSKIKPHEEEFIIFDVGAHAGKYALSISENIKHINHKIYSFEPLRYTYKKLLSNTRQNHRIQALNLALGEVEGVAEFYTNHQGSAASSFYPEGYGQWGGEIQHKEKVPINAIDEICNLYQIDRIHFLKIDVEGHELSVLKGAKEMLSNDKIDIIQFEVSNFYIYSGTFFKTIYDYLAAFDYQIFRLLPDGLYKINYRPEYEIYRMANFIAKKW